MCVCAALPSRPPQVRYVSPERSASAAGQGMGHGAAAGAAQHTAGSQREGGRQAVTAVLRTYTAARRPRQPRRPSSPRPAPAPPQATHTPGLPTRRRTHGSIGTPQPRIMVRRLASPRPQQSWRTHGRHTGREPNKYSLLATFIILKLYIKDSNNYSQL